MRFVKYTQEKDPYAHYADGAQVYRPEAMDIFEGTEIRETKAGLVQIWDGDKLVACVKLKPGEVVRAAPTDLSDQKMLSKMGISSSISI
jgi:hypothetical protein